MLQSANETYSSLLKFDWVIVSSLCMVFHHSDRLESSRNVGISNSNHYHSGLIGDNVPIVLLNIHLIATVEEDVFLEVLKMLVTIRPY